MQLPLISLIMTVFNEEKLISQALESLLNQTYQPLEIIVINDGSTDRTEERIQESPARNRNAQALAGGGVRSQNHVRRGQNRNIKIFDQPHLGLGAARNHGAKKARGEIIVFVDADINYDRNYIKNLVKPILEKKTIGTFHNEEYVANITNYWAYGWNINDHVSIGRRQHPNLKESIYYRAIKKKEFLKVKGFDNIGYLHDMFLCEKLGQKAIAAPFAFCYHHNPESAKDVFETARYLGRGLFYKHKIRTLAQYSPLNTLRRIIIDTWQSKMWFFPIFKTVFDLGVLAGVARAVVTREYAGK